MSGEGPRASGIQQVHDFQDTLLVGPPLLVLPKLSQLLLLIEKSVQFGQESLHVQRSLWAAEWRTDRLR